MRRQPREKGNRIIMGCMLALLAGMSMTSVAKSRELMVCEKAYITDYLHVPLHKAVATTGGRALGIHPTACGFATGYRTRKLAEKAAIMSCNKSKSKGYPGDCTIIEEK